MNPWSRLFLTLGMKYMLMMGIRHAVRKAVQEELRKQ